MLFVQADWDHDPPILSYFTIAEMTDVDLHSHLFFCCDGVLKTFDWAGLEHGSYLSLSRS
jgi:hypothetical protein